MACVLFLASALGWFMYHVRIQQEAVAAVKQAGGGVIYSCNWRNGRFDPQGKPGVPEWLLQRLGPDFFYSVKYAGVFTELGSRADDNLMTRLGQLRELEALYVDGNDVTDLGLAHLKSLTTLRSLYLQGTGVTDTGLKHLKTMKSLEALNLENTRVTTAGVEQLKRELNQYPPKALISHGLDGQLCEVTLGVRRDPGE
jgi:Leucine Rich repeat